MKKLGRFSPLVLAIVLSVSACTSSNTVAPGDLDTTEAGIATGAVLGAGLGALVGSTSGDAGAGLVVGSVAGAASGGMIGRAIEGQEKRLDIHDNKSGVNSARIVEDKRGRLGDKIWLPSGKFNPDNEFNKPSGQRGAAAEFYETQPNARIQPAKIHQIKTENRVASTETDLLGEEIPAFNQSSRGNTLPVALGNNNLPSKKTTETAIISSGEIETASMPTEVPVRTPSVNGSSSSGRARLITPKKTTPAPKKAIPRLPSTSSVAKKTIKSPVKISQGNVCSKGQSEYDRAQNSVSDSDKVFYLRRTILSCPKSANIRVELGKVYGRLGLKEDARKELNAALELDPGNEAAQDELSIMMLDAE